jgi:hypothetical protein
MMKSYLFIFLVIMFYTFCSCKTELKETAPLRTDISEFIGHWAIDINGGAVGYLDLRQEEGYLDADLLWGGGFINPVSNVFLSKNNTIIIQRSTNVVRKMDEQNNPLRTHIITNWLEIIRDEDGIRGMVLTPRRNSMGVDTNTFVGKKVPPLPEASDLSAVKYAEPITLFNGKDLTGWKATKEGARLAFKVVDGTLVNDPVQPEVGEHIRYGNLRTEAEFEDFNIKLEYKIPQGSNSGVYLRGMYEVQVADTYGKPLNLGVMGGIFGRIAPTVSAEKPAGEWQTLDITLCERHVTVKLNGVMIIDNQPLEGPTGGALKSDVLTPGPIYLQGDHGYVAFRNIILTPIIK